MPRVRFTVKPDTDRPIVVTLEYHYWTERYIFQFENGQIIVRFARQRIYKCGPPELYKDLTPKDAIDEICRSAANLVLDGLKNALLGALTLMLGAPGEEWGDEEEVVVEEEEEEKKEEEQV